MSDLADSEDQNGRVSNQGLEEEETSMDGEMITTFASVFVKVEVQSDNPSEEEERFCSIMEKNTDDSQNERNRKKKIDDTADDGNKKKEERLQKARARSKRYREKKRNETAALLSGGLTDADREKREERLRYDREKSKRYREKKKIEALSMDAAHSSSDSSSSKLKKERQKQNSKRVTTFEEPILKTERKRGKRPIPTTIIKCSQCDYTTNFKHCLDIHIRSHSEERPFLCNLCDYTSKYQTALTRHKKTMHNEERDGKYKCPECDYTSNYKWNLKSHIGKHDTQKTFKCIHCDFETSYKQSYLKHNKVQHDGLTLYKCDKCPFQTKYEGHITRHLAKLHNEVFETGFKCEYCDFSTKYNWRLTIHNRRMQREQPFKCNYPDCSFEIFYKCGLKKHKGTHFRLNSNKTPKSIMRVGTVEESQAIIANISEYVNKLSNAINNANIATNGNICDVSEVNLASVYENEQNNYQTTPQLEDETDNFNSKPVLPVVSSHGQANNYVLDPKGVDWNSIDVLESDDKEKPFKCVKCRYMSKFKASVQRHYQRHHTGNKKTYKCTNCDFSTKTKDQISLHNKRSLSALPLICTICNFTTHFKCTSVMHQKSHYENKCELCNYICKYKHELQRHVSIHHVGGGQKCRFCDYKSFRKESLLCHETIHTGQKPYKCPFCDYSSVRRSLLEIHCKRYHSTQKDFVVIDQNKIQSLRISLAQAAQAIENNSVSNNGFE